MKRKLLLFDVDGTLVAHPEGTVPESALKALEKLRKHHVVALSTGRDMDTHYSRKYAACLKADATIHLNGAKVTAEGQLLYEHVMDRNLVRALCGFARENGLCIGAILGDRDYYTDPEKRLMADEELGRGIVRTFYPVAELYETDVKVTAMNLCMDLARGKELIEAAFPDVQVVGYSGGTSADLIEKGFSKAEGMRRLCRHYGIEEKDTVAFGDSLNDIPIVEAAGIGVAMGNAHEELKKVADLVTEDIRADGIYKACEKLGLFL